MTGGLGDVVADRELSWARPDGWQCLVAPGWLYGKELLPPVEAVEDEVGGAVLGIGVDSAQHVQIAFRLDGVLRMIAFGDAVRATHYGWREQMVQDWGSSWRREGAVALCRWAADRGIEPPSPMGVYGALWARHRRPESAAFALLDVLGLGPGPNPPWWVLAVPGARFAVRARDMVLPVEPAPGANEGSRDDVVVAFVATGVGVYDLGTRAWLVPPDPSYGKVLDRLVEELEARGWTQAPAGSPAGMCALHETTARALEPLAWPGRATVTPAPSEHGKGVTVAPDIFGPPSDIDWDGWDTGAAFFVRSLDVEGAADALQRVKDRLMCVDDQGTELTEEELASTDRYTPNWVSEVERRKDGAEIIVDTKGELTGPMGRTMLRILTRELRAAGLTAHVASARQPAATG